MTRDQANNAVVQLKGLFPRMTLDQARRLSIEFEHFPMQAVDDAIAAHFKLFPDLVVPTLLSQVRQNTLKIDAADDKRRAAERAQEAEIAMRWQAIDAAFELIVEGLSEDAMTKLREDAVASLEESIRPLFVHRDPRHSPTLRAAIVALFNVNKPTDQGGPNVSAGTCA